MDLYFRYYGNLWLNLISFKYAYLIFILKNLYGYTHLYDALRLYALAVRRSMNETDNPDIYLDGKFIWNQMRRMTFPGNFVNKNMSGDLISDIKNI